MSEVETAYFNRTTARTLAVLEALSRGEGGMGLAELSRELDCPKASLYPILRTMETMGYIQRDRSGYVLTARVLEVARGYLAQTPLLDIFRDIGQRVVAAVQETMQLGILSGTDVVYAAKRESARPVQLVSDVGRRIPAYATALGKCLLAGLPDAEITRLYAGQPMVPLTARTTTDLESLLRSVHQVRQQGYAEDLEEVSEGLCCIAAPVRDAEGAVVAAVSFSLPVQRADGDHWSELRQEVQRTAKQISARLGHSV